MHVVELTLKGHESRLYYYVQGVYIPYEEYEKICTIRCNDGFVTSKHTFSKDDLIKIELRAAT